METISQKIKNNSTNSSNQRKPMSATAGSISAKLNATKSIANGSMAANRLQANASAQKKKPELKFIGFGDKSILNHNLGKDDVADKLKNSDTFGLTPEEIIKLEEKKMREKIEREKKNPFLRNNDRNKILFAKNTSNDEKIAYEKALNGSQVQSNDTGKTSFNNYRELKKDDQHAFEKVSDKKFNSNVFKKR